MSSSEREEREGEREKGRQNLGHDWERSLAFTYYLRDQSIPKATKLNLLMLATVIEYTVQDWKHNNIIKTIHSFIHLFTTPFIITYSSKSSDLSIHSSSITHNPLSIHHPSTIHPSSSIHHPSIYPSSIIHTYIHPSSIHHPSIYPSSIHPSSSIHPLFIYETLLGTPASSRQTFSCKQVEVKYDM